MTDQKDLYNGGECIKTYKGVKDISRSGTFKSVRGELGPWNCLKNGGN